MAVTEVSGAMKYKDASGNISVLYPITKKENVQGLNDGFTKGFTTAGTGAAYTVNIPGITALEKGLSFTLIPHTNSTAASPTLNVNGLGAKYLMQRISTNTGATATGSSTNWIVANMPVTVTYNGTLWAVDLVRPDAATINGTVPVAKGGTGQSSLTAGSYLVGNGTSNVVLKTLEEVKADLGLNANLRAVVGSYNGSGTFGPSNPNTLTFDFEPLAVILVHPQDSDVMNPSICFINGQTECGEREASSTVTRLKLAISWSGNTVSWYVSESNPSTDGFKSGAQRNGANVVYHYIAIG